MYSAAVSTQQVLGLITWSARWFASSSLPGFTPGTPIFSHSPETCWNGKLMRANNP